MKRLCPDVALCDHSRDKNCSGILKDNGQCSYFELGDIVQNLAGQGPKDGIGFVIDKDGHVGIACEFHTEYNPKLRLIKYAGWIRKFSDNNVEEWLI